VIDLNLNRLKRKRDETYKHWKKYKTVQLAQKLKELNLDLKQELYKTNKKRIEKNLNSNDPKLFWRAVNQELGKADRQQLEISINGNIIKDPKTLVSEFKTSFEEKIKSNVRKLNKNNEPISPKPIKELSGFQNEKIFWRSEDIKNIIEAMSNKKSTGQDELQIVVYKDSLEITLPHITKLMNLIAVEESIPSNWRVAKIIPVHKKGNKQDLNNYRPVSNICCLSKIYEKLILLYITRLEKKDRCLSVRSSSTWICEI